MELGKFINKVRSLNNLSLRDLAARSNVSISQLSKIERGNHIPSSKTILKIATALNINPDDLLDKKPIAPVIKIENHTYDYLRYKVFSRDNFTCQLCGTNAPTTSIEIDFINPLSLGGEQKPENMITLCRECHYGRNISLELNGIDEDYLLIKHKNVDQ